MDEYSLWSQILHRFKETCDRIDSQWIKRRRVFKSESLIFLLFKLVANSKGNYSSVIHNVFGCLDVIPSSSSFCESRSKFLSHYIEDLREEIMDAFDSNTSLKTWHGLHIYSVDGTKVSLPRELYSEGFKAPSSGFCPQGLISALVRAEDKMICDIELTSNENERLAAHKHLDKLSHKDLVIYDRGYLCFSLLVAHCYSGVHALFRVQKGGAFVEVDKFWRSKKSSIIVTVDPTSSTYRSIAKSHPEYDAKPVRIRLIKYKIGKEVYMLATTLLDEKIPVSDFIDLYPKRWFSEEVYKALKKSLGIENFHSRKLNGIEQEVQSSALLWNLTQMLVYIQKNTEEKRKTRHHYQANSKQATLRVASQAVEIFSNLKSKAWKALKNVVFFIQKTALPIRNNRTFPRQSLRPPTHWKKPNRKMWKPKGRPRGRPKLKLLTE
jgi:hypothetical protein